MTEDGPSRHNVGRWMVIVLVTPVAMYLVSYIALRCTVLESSAKQVTRDGATRITTWCYYPDGDNWQTTWSNRVFAPLIHGERMLFPPTAFE